jgi:Protein of unknown function (DUF3592)
MLNSRIGQRWIFRSNSGWLGGDRITDVSVLTACSCFVILGLLMLAKVGMETLSAGAAAQWPTTLGTVVSVQVDELEYGNSVSWFPRVGYRYSVHGRSMLSTQLTPGPQPHWRDRADAERFLERYLNRTGVVVYFNPDNPADAVLEPSHSGRTEPMVGLGVVLVALGFWCLALYDWLR